MVEDEADSKGHLRQQKSGERDLRNIRTGRNFVNAAASSLGPQVFLQRRGRLPKRGRLSKQLPFTATVLQENFSIS
jgi:hypothetical protein